MKSFSDLGVQPITKAFSGNKIDIADVINQQIIVSDWKIEPSKYKKGEIAGICLYIAIKFEGKDRLIFSGSKRGKAMTTAEKRRWAEDKVFYAEIWDASPHICQNCAAPLGNEPLTLFFHHLLEKEPYPQFRHTPENIMIICPDCHSRAHGLIDKVPKIRERREEVYKILIK